MSGLSVHFKDVTHDFGAVRVLDDVSLEVDTGELVAIIGPSGCGKSTLLTLTAGLISPSQGAILVDDTPVDGPDRAARTSFMFSRDNLMPWRTALQNVVLGLELRRSPDRDTLGRQMLERLGLAGFEDAYPSQLSHGMRQRVAIARTLITSPALVFMDEPFGALDAQTRVIVENEFLTLWQETSPTVLFVTHDLTEAIVVADRIVVMSHRPARMKLIIDVRIPRPRDAATIELDPRFAALKKRLWDALMPELGSSDGN